MRKLNYSRLRSPILFESAALIQLHSFNCTNPEFAKSASTF